MDHLGGPPAPPPTTTQTPTTTASAATSSYTTRNSNTFSYTPFPLPQPDYHADHRQHLQPPLAYLNQDQFASAPANLGFEPSPLATSYYFDEAYRPSPSPPVPNNSFLDGILNPESQIFGYSVIEPPTRSNLTYQTHTMPPSRATRRSNDYVDLTSLAEATTSSRPKRHNSTSGPSSHKRLKREDDAAAYVEEEDAKPIDEIDLSGDKDSVQAVLQKQREEAIKAQQKPEEKATTFRNINCVICMDTPTNLTATSCGHLFCHQCLMEALIAGENRAAPGEPKRSQCPVCRKILNRTKERDIIPLAFMKGPATQPRKTATVAAIAKTTSTTVKSTPATKGGRRMAPVAGATPSTFSFISRAAASARRGTRRVGYGGGNEG
ncbi:unnamed protein product [Periconia digitata]|uniref:RING-type domain-containing protein n=1 Tax=Periconia digitata TaxID=1303443 RepID=A0A9W4XTX3_9PLEO|nr:unnamed protein product [Periconia digitata]